MRIQNDPPVISQVGPYPAMSGMPKWSLLSTTPELLQVVARVPLEHSPITSARCGLPPPSAMLSISTDPLIAEIQTSGWLRSTLLPPLIAAAGAWPLGP